MRKTILLLTSKLLLISKLVYNLLLDIVQLNLFLFIQGLDSFPSIASLSSMMKLNRSWSVGKYDFHFKLNMIIEVLLLILLLKFLQVVSIQWNLRLRPLANKFMRLPLHSWVVLVSIDMLYVIIRVKRLRSIIVNAACFLSWSRSIDESLLE